MIFSGARLAAAGGAVDGSEIRREHQLRPGKFPIIYRVVFASQVVQDFNHQQLETPGGKGPFPTQPDPP